VTPRQQQCLALRDQGLAVKVIAKQLGLSPNTVKDALTGARNALRRDGALPPLIDGKSLTAKAERKLLGLLSHTPMGSREIGVAMPELSARQIERHINRMAKTGAIVKQGNGRSLVWMTHGHAKTVEVKRKRIVIVDIRPTAPTVSISAGKHQYPIDTSRAKITIVPTPKGRFHVEMPMGSGAISQDWLARRMA
jgi:hypothetical protein